MCDIYVAGCIPLKMEGQKERKRKYKEEKIRKQEEQQRKAIEEIRLKEWEAKFDEEQKTKEHEEILKDERIRLREEQQNKAKFQNQENINEELTSRLENFEVKQTKEN